MVPENIGTFLEKINEIYFRLLGKPACQPVPLA